jgi:hypothetical protein
MLVVRGAGQAMPCCVEMPAGIWHGGCISCGCADTAAAAVTRCICFRTCISSHVSPHCLLYCCRRQPSCCHPMCRCLTPVLSHCTMLLSQCSFCFFVLTLQLVLCGRPSWRECLSLLDAVASMLHPAATHNALRTVLVICSAGDAAWAAQLAGVSGAG